MWRLSVDLLKLIKEGDSVQLVGDVRYLDEVVSRSQIRGAAEVSNLSTRVWYCGHGVRKFTLRFRASDSRNVANNYSAGDVVPVLEDVSAKKEVYNNAQPL
jgi:hypothetical protein